jgi:hypothetical protein
MNEDEFDRLVAEYEKIHGVRSVSTFWIDTMGPFDMTRRIKKALESGTEIEYPTVPPGILI